MGVKGEKEKQRSIHIGRKNPIKCSWDDTIEMTDEHYALVVGSWINRLKSLFSSVPPHPIFRRVLIAMLVGFFDSVNEIVCAFRNDTSFMTYFGRSKNTRNKDGSTPC